MPIDAQERSAVVMTGEGGNMGRLALVDWVGVTAFGVLMARPRAVLGCSLDEQHWESLHVSLPDFSLACSLLWVWTEYLGMCSLIIDYILSSQREGGREGGR